MRSADAPLPLARMRGVVLAPERAQRVEAHHLRIVELAQAVHVEHDDLAQLRQPRAHFQHLVELLVVLDEQVDRARIRAADTRPAPARRSDRCRSTRRRRRECPGRRRAIRGWCWRASRRIRPARSRARPAPCRSRARSGRTRSRSCSARCRTASGAGSTCGAARRVTPCQNIFGTVSVASPRHRQSFLRFHRRCSSHAAGLHAEIELRMSSFSASRAQVSSITMRPTSST